MGKSRNFFCEDVITCNLKTAVYSPWFRNSWKWVKVDARAVTFQIEMKWLDINSSVRITFRLLIENTMQYDLMSLFQKPVKLSTDCKL